MTSKLTDMRLVNKYVKFFVRDLEGEISGVDTGRVMGQIHHKKGIEVVAIWSNTRRDYDEMLNDWEGWEWQINMSHLHEHVVAVQDIIFELDEDEHAEMIQQEKTAESKIAKTLSKINTRNKFKKP